jgi:hypothetical protein
MKLTLFLIATFFTLHIFAQQAPTTLNIDSMMRALETQAIGKQLDSFEVFYHGKNLPIKTWWVRPFLLIFGTLPVCLVWQSLPSLTTYMIR